MTAERPDAAYQSQKPSNVIRTIVICLAVLLPLYAVCGWVVFR